MPGIAKTIAHLEDLRPDEFLRFLEKYKDLPLKGGLEISEKLDGSARITFGISDRKVWVASKNTPAKHDPNAWGSNPIFSAIRAAHEVLSDNSDRIISNWPSGLESLTAEVLRTQIPNTIEYGPDAIVVHGHHGHVKDSDVREFVKQVGSLGSWKFEYKSLVDPKNAHVDVTKEYDSIKQIYDDLKKLERDRLKAAGKLPYSQTLQKFKEVQRALKKKLVQQLHGMSSTMGPKGGDVEGLVFKDLESGSMTKLVDRDYFTKLNQFFWKYRELLNKGANVGNQWKVGLIQGLLSVWGDEIIGYPAAKTPGFVSQLEKFRSGLSYPPDADTPEKRTDYLLAKFVEHHGILEGDIVAKAKVSLKQTQDELQKLRASWEGERDSASITLDKGGQKKTVVMNDLVKKRTDQAFDVLYSTLSEFSSSLEKIDSFSGITKKVAFLKLFLGHRLSKLHGTDVVEGLVAETVKKMIREDAPTTARTKITTGILHAYVDRLTKRGIDAKEAWVLGTGSHGTAFDLGNGRVLKITDDVAEAKASAAIKGKKNRHIVNVFDVFRFPDEEGTWFGIVAERLVPLADAEAKEFYLAVKMIEGKLDFWNRAQGRQVFAPWMQDWSDIEDQAIDQADEESNGDAKVKKAVLDKLKVLKKYKMPEIIEDLMTSGIEFRDFHGGNLMRRGNGDIVINDLGYSRVNGSANIPKLNEDVHDVADKMPMLKKTAEEHGFKLGEQLGMGSNGVAFAATSNGRPGVVKFTTDVSEAKTSFHIRGKKLKHVVNVHSVARIPNTPVYLIFQERLRPLSDDEFDGVDRLVGYLESCKAGPEMLRGDINGCMQKFLKVFKKKVLIDDFTMLVKHFQFDSIIKELADNQIEFLDYHAGNIMKRFKTYVVLDLGMSRSPGAEPPELGPAKIDKAAKKITESLISEQRADMVGVTIGRFQPFTKGHGEMIRQLTAKFDKVLVIVAGNSKDKKNPFSFETRVDMMKRSLPDVWTKIEIHKAEFGGRNSGYLPGVLGDIIKNKNSTLEADVAVNILVGDDRFSEIQQQIKHAQGYKEQGNEISFDPSMATVMKLPDVKNNGDDERVSGTTAREMIIKGDKDGFKKIVDAHLLSNPGDFEEIWVKLRGELGLKENKLNEVKFSSKEIDEIIKVNADKLARKGYTPQHSVGSGYMGKAFEIAGRKILKITTDVTEARASFALKDKKLKRVVEIYDVFRFPQLDMVKTPYYGVVQEMLQPLSEEEHNNIFIATDTIEMTLGIVQRDWANDWEKTVRDLQSAAKGILDQNPNPNKATLFQVKEIREAIDIVQKYDLPGICDELSQHGVRWGDLHVGNLMKRGNTIVAVDLGLSDTKGPVPPMLEKIRDLVKENMKKSIKENPFDGAADSAPAEKDSNKQLAAAGGETVLKTIAVANRNILIKKYGIDPNNMQRLGNGMDGVAYDIGGDKVLKLTTDVGEAKASYSIKGKTKKHVVRVYDAFRFLNNAKNNSAIYGIILEKLEKMSPAEFQEYDESLEDYLFDKTVNDLLPSADETKIMQAIYEVIKSDLEKAYGTKLAEGVFDSQVPSRSQVTGAARPRAKAMPAGDRIQRKQASMRAEIDKQYDIVEAAFKKFQIIEILQELKSEGIEYYDIHKGNLMKRGQDFVITDLGRSTTNGATEPPVAETVNRLMGAVIGKMGSSSWSSSSKIAGPTKKGTKKTLKDK